MCQVSILLDHGGLPGSVSRAGWRRQQSPRAGICSQKSLALPGAVPVSKVVRRTARRALIPGYELHSPRWRPVSEGGTRLAQSRTVVERFATGPVKGYLSGLRQIEGGDVLSLGGGRTDVEVMLTTVCDPTRTSPSVALSCRRAMKPAMSALGARSDISVAETDFRVCEGFRMPSR
jgi:hypothetical protein